MRKILLNVCILFVWMLNLRSSLSLTSAVLCSRIPGLSPAQRELCTESPDALIALATGRFLGVQECQHQFKGHRWNCTEAWPGEVFSHVIPVGSREAAFTYAVASAGAVHAITSACARGNISLCGCDRAHHHSHSARNYQLRQLWAVNNGVGSSNRPWKWGGCSADIKFGMSFARRFLDAREIEGDTRSLMNLHNNRVGRKIVKNLLRTDCKCHGISGSCAMKTCWKSLPPFRIIGNALKKKYNRAKLVHAVTEKDGLSLVVSKAHNISKNMKKRPRPRRLELVHIEKSPNYCERNLNVGSLGTRGRSCNKTDRGIEGCDFLCCGRGYNTYQVNKTWQCRCQFQWCCTVHCDNCTQLTRDYICK